MKKIGLVGGISWTSTLDYYRYINTGINEQLGGLNFAECIIYSVNFNRFQKYTSEYNWDGTYALLLDAAKSLKNAGADAILLCANTAHIVADRIQHSIGLPLINIIDATAAEINKHNLQKVGLLGTTYTMELDFYKDKLRAAGIEPLIPETQEERDFIEHSLRYELGKGIINPATKEGYLNIIRTLISRGAQGIILGCTEIPLLIHPSDVDLPVFDTTKIHAAAAVEFAVSGHLIPDHT